VIPMGNYVSDQGEELRERQTATAGELRERRHLSAVIDADAWAKTEAMPSDTEIQRIRHLITRMQADITDLTDEDRAQIADAVAVVRQHRQRITSLGIPRTRQPQPHDLPEHTP
ncbi:hypothetical protein AB0H83_51475, partial [Dactylosporangium sp. NPDC050688]|uniref:hypothetical protein n=1 Tax=Dactylosporangium sp. NPDC050688 TaxID=3157217 RepID=UPI003409EA79